MSKTRLRQYRLAAPLFVLVLLIGGMSAMTVGAQSSDGRIYACVTASTGVLYNVGTTQPDRCNTGDTQISWTQEAGASGVAWYGVWDDATTYPEGAMVTYNGAAWVSTEAGNTGEPGVDDGWEQISAQGPQGDPGLTWRGDWNGATAYAEDDAVHHNGSAWISTVADNTGEPGVDTGWDLLAERGDDGDDGDDGQDGEPGLVWRGNWDAGTTYEDGDAVHYEGSAWISTSDDNTGNVPGVGAGWDLLAERGDDGTDGEDGDDGQDGEPGLVWRGNWDAGTTYEDGDAVHYEGSAWISTSDDNTGNVPGVGAGWDLLAEQGERGPQGEEGEDGAPGAAGATGPTGPAGPGVPTGGEEGQILAKDSDADYDTEWIDPPSGLLNFTTVSSTTGSSATKTATCPTGYGAIGGGGIADDNESIRDSYPSNANSSNRYQGDDLARAWTVRWSSGDSNHRVYAICVQTSS